MNEPTAAPAPRSTTAAWLAAGLMLVVASLSGCAGRSPASPTPPTPPAPPASATREAEPVHLRTIGPREQGGTVVLRVGDRLDVVPERRFGGWTVVEVPAAILRLDGSPGAAASHTLTAVAIGEGQLTLSAAGPEARSIGRYTVQIHVVRDTVQGPGPP